MPVPNGSRSQSDAQDRVTSYDTEALRADSTLRLYAVVRGDLEMSPGKMAAQAGHAFLGTLHDAESNWDCDSDEYRDYLRYKDEAPGTKIVLVCPDEASLRRYYEQVSKFLPSSLIFDSGHVLPPHFDGSSTLTALGVGPCTRAKAAPFLGRLALVP